jgi:hypothetical protein
MAAFLLLGFLLGLFLCGVDISVYGFWYLGRNYIGEVLRSFRFIMRADCSSSVSVKSTDEIHGGQLFLYLVHAHSSALLHSAHFDFLLNFFLFFGCLVADARATHL